MKNILMTFFVICQLNMYSQSEKFAGEYIWTSNPINGSFKYTLTVQADGTFIFHSYTYHNQAISPETNKYGKGNWTAEKDIISFTVNSNADFDKKHTLDLNNSKARFISKSPRDKSDRIVETRIKFYKTAIRWMEGIEMLKQ